MKKLLITMTATLVCVGAFAQGKVGFAASSDHLVYLTTDTSKIVAGDGSAAGKGLNSTLIGSLAGAPSIVADLYAGTSATSLTKMTTAAFGLTEGRWTSVNVALPSAPAFPAGTTAWFQIQIHDARATNAASAWGQNGWYAGETAVFTAVPSPTAYSSLYINATAPFSTWLPGASQITDMTAGNFGAIEVYATIPEPGTFALAGLGMATLLIFRRRK